LSSCCILPPEFLCPGLSDTTGLLGGPGQTAIAGTAQAEAAASANALTPNFQGIGAWLEELLSELSSFFQTVVSDLETLGIVLVAAIVIVGTLYIYHEAT
jgi:hypothetical protein